MAPRTHQWIACVAQRPGKGSSKANSNYQYHLAILGDTNCLDLRAQYAYSILLKNTARVQVHSTIQCRLSAERYQYAIGAFAFDNLSHRILQEKASLAVYLFDELARHRQQVGTRREAFARLHCGNVRVDKHGLDTRLVQRL